MTAKTIRILINEDSAADAELELREFKRAGLRIAHRIVDTAESFRSALREFAPDVILSDFTMPGFDGMQALAIARQFCPDTPFVYVSGTIGEEHAIRALKNGATDYVLKTNLLRLPAAVERALAEAEARRQRCTIETELRESESVKRAILEASLDCVITIDHEGKIVEFNPAAEATFGYTRGQALGKPLVELIIPPRFRDAHRRGIAKYLATGEGPILGKRLELEASRADGTAFPVELAVTALLGTSAPMFTAFLRDITARRDADRRIHRLNRVYAVLSGINSLIVRVHERRELFNEACRIVVEHGKFAMAWIGVLDPATQDVRPVAWAGESAEELSRSNSSASEYSPRGTGPVGRAFREQHPVFDNDITARDAARPRLQKMVSLGFRSQITLPLFENRAVVAALTMYAREPDFFDEEELRLLTGLAGDISFAIENIRRQEKLDKLARIRAVSGEINAAIVRIHDREALLRETCRIAVEHGKFELVWIALLDQEKQRIEPVAWAGFSPEVAHALTWANLGRPGVLLAEVIRTRKVAVRNDIDAEIPAGSLRQEAIKKGYRSAVCVPFMVDDSVVAAVVLFAAGREFFDEEELALLSELAGDVSFALQAIDKQERLDYLAYYDVLTGLANRSLFLERVAQHMRSAASGGHKLAMGLIDLERFKNINDSLGRPTGDALLKQVAQWLTRNLGDANLVARLGADHFAVVLPEVKPEGDVARLVEKLMEAFLEHPFRLNDAVFRIAAKVGVVVFPDDGADADTLFRNAEAALKKAKASGDRYLFYTQKMTEMVAGKLTLETQLRQALDGGEFVLHYQPKVSLTSGKLTGAEALIRWNDPRTGLVPPARFIPVLEETGLIHEAGRWALRQALSDYLRRRAAGLAAVRIAVNVSPLQLRNRGFIAEIQQAIGIDAHAAAGLELEITESLIMEDVKHSIASLQAIRAMGVTIAIDDFGTGFSSLSYLARLPVDTLKIDRSFVTDMTAGPEGLTLVSTIIALAHSLKLKVVAEGVETEKQSNLLRLLKCDEMQGYLFSKPLPGEIFETRYLAAPVAD
jgi:diguanylate cyclase (GGDEF)-like protein/PAS domain S-box-containing protein